MSQVVDHALDQKAAETHPGQAPLRVGDRIEDRRVGAFGIDRRRPRVEQRVNIGRHALDQRHLDEDQGLVGHAGMKESEAPAIGIEAILEIGPGANLVHRLVAHQLFEQRGRRVPGHAPQTVGAVCCEPVSAPIP